MLDSVDTSANASAGAGVNPSASAGSSTGKQANASVGKGATASAGKRALATIQVASKTVNLFVLALVVAAVAIAIYALTDINSVVVNGAPEQYEIYKPGEEQKSFEELIVINPEVIGWIQVYGTKIDYPVTQAKNNDRYLSYGPDLKYSLLGSIFLDCNNEPDFSDFNNILYGHNMTPRAMFGNIKDFKDQAYFDAHKYGDLFYKEDGRFVHRGLEIFAIFEDDGYSPFVKKTEFADAADKQAYLDAIYEKALLSRDIGVTVDDRLVMMYTCSNALTNGRELLMARITERTFDNTFAEDETVRFNFFGLFERFPVWILPFLILLILLLIWYMMKRQERKRLARARAAAGVAEAAQATQAQELVQAVEAQGFAQAAGEGAQGITQTAQAPEAARAAVDAPQEAARAAAAAASVPPPEGGGAQ